LARFVAVRTARSASVWGLVMGLYTWASVVGFLGLAPTAAGRRTFVAALASNTGLKALMGDTHRIDTIGGFVTWRVAGVMALVGALWGLLVSVRAMRGEEGAGRWELFLTGRTTRRRAAAGALVGVGSGVLLMFVLTAGVALAVGSRSDVGFGVEGSLLLAVGAVASAAEFVAVGALASQIMPIRGRAVALSAIVFGVSFVMRAVGDVAPAAHWLIYVSPLGWIEQLHCLTDPRPMWLLPIVGFITVLVLATLLLAGRRDLGAGTLADKDSAEPHLRLLGSHALLSVRLTCTSALSWVAVVGLMSLLYGTLTRSAGDAFASSGAAKTVLGGLTHQDRQSQGARTFAAVFFLTVMLLLMGYVASAAGSIREEEAEGYLDNLLVRRVRRGPWLAVRVAIAAIVAVIAGLVAGVGFWLGGARNAQLSLRELTLAGVNAAAPAILLLGMAILVVGFLPRWTTTASYGVLAWSFLIDMLGSVIHLNHWVVDTSLLQHPALAPAADPNWRVVATYVVLGAVLALVGGRWFVGRDLQGN
jgi:ABC-2 type transport system permease protein